MTLRASAAISGPYTVTEGQTDFVFDFRVHSASEIAVQLDGRVVAASEYSVALDADNGGTVTFNAPPKAGGKVAILRNMTFAQDLDLQQNEAFHPEVVETTFDRIVMMLQQLNEVCTRTLKIDTTSEESVDAFMDRFFGKAEAAIAAAEAAAASATAAAASATAAAEAATVAGETLLQAQELSDTLSGWEIGISSAGSAQLEALGSATDAANQTLVLTVSGGSETLDTIVSGGSENLTSIVSGGSENLTAIVSGGSENLTAIVSGGSETLTGIVSSGSENLTSIISGGSETITAVISGGGVLLDQITTSGSGYLTLVVSEGEAQKKEVGSKGQETISRIEQMLSGGSEVNLKLTNYYTKAETNTLVYGVKGGLTVITEEMAGGLRSNLYSIIDETTPDEDGGEYES